MSKPGQSLSEKPCEPHFGFQDQQSQKQTNMDLVAKKDMDMSVLKTIFVSDICSVYGSYPYLPSKMHLSRTVPFHII